MPSWLQIELSVAAVLVVIIVPTFTGIVGLLVRQGRQAERLENLKEQVLAQNQARKEDHKELREDHDNLRNELHADHKRSYELLMGLRGDLAEVRGRLDANK